MWKIDRWLIPWLCLLYLLSFLDRTNIGNARLAGMEDDLGMGGHDYNNALTIFFVSHFTFLLGCSFFVPARNILLRDEFYSRSATLSRSPLRTSFSNG